MSGENSETQLLAAGPNNVVVNERSGAETDATPKPKFGKGIKHSVTATVTSASRVGDTMETRRTEGSFSACSNTEPMTLRQGSDCMDADAFIMSLTDEEKLPPPLAPGRGGVTKPFPLILYDMLDNIEDDGMGSVVSWQPHGRCFLVRNPKVFVDVVMPKYFRQSKFASFQRQLNLYGFSRCTVGKDKGAYYHRLFLRGNRDLCNRMMRIKIKGTKVRKAASPDREPNFYAMPPVEMYPLKTTMEEENVADPTTKSAQPTTSAAAAASPRSTVPCPLDGVPGLTLQQSAPVPVSPLSCPQSVAVTAPGNPLVLANGSALPSNNCGEVTVDGGSSDATLSSDSSRSESSDVEDYLDVLLHENKRDECKEESQSQNQDIHDPMAVVKSEESAGAGQLEQRVYQQPALPIVPVATAIQPNQMPTQQGFSSSIHDFLRIHGIAPPPCGSTTFILVAPTPDLVQSATHQMPPPACLIASAGTVQGQIQQQPIQPIAPTVVQSAPLPVPPPATIALPPPAPAPAPVQISDGLGTGDDVAFFEGKPFQCWN